MTKPPGTRRGDPRLYQISVLSAFLLFGTLFLEFRVGIVQIALVAGSVMVVQALGTRLGRLPAFDPRSPLISALSLCLILRVDQPWLAAAAAAVAIGSKFLLRWNGKHIFNPTAFGIVVVVALSDRAWFSPAQWGSAPTVAFLVACLGGLVVHRAARSDVAYAFAATYAGVVMARAAWLGQPWSAPAHQLANGARLRFTFFMISDPKTTPNARPARLLYGALVALGAAFVSFVLFRPGGPIWSLVALSPLVPVLDRFVPGQRYEWTRPTAGVPSKGDTHETMVPGSRPLAPVRALGAARP
jgi:Na+-transporting NADH:ubiquinone oxidoreductase subunit NqrB